QWGTGRHGQTARPRTPRQPPRTEPRPAAPNELGSSPRIGRPPGSFPVGWALTTTETTSAREVRSVGGAHPTGKNGPETRAAERTREPVAQCNRATEPATPGTRRPGPSRETNPIPGRRGLARVRRRAWGGPRTNPGPAGRVARDDRAGGGRPAWEPISSHSP